MKHLVASDYRIMPWKNGGGTTTEVAIFPADSVIYDHPFDWRVSIADVASDGPFSRFPGYDRHIMIIDGGGMHLVSADCAPIRLNEPLLPRSFSGDWTVEARLVDGPVRDFNLMSRRELFQSKLSCLAVDESRLVINSIGTSIVHVLAGELIVAGRIVGLGDTLVLDKGERLTLSPLADLATIALAEVMPLPSS